MEKIHNYLINKIFTVPYLDRLISDKVVPDSFRKCIAPCNKGDTLTYGEAISCVYNYMDSSYRNEYYFKNAILNKLLVEKHDLCRTAAFTELPIAESKADFVMINGHGVVYEIKTDLDNFNRMENQIKDYYKAFDYVNLVVSSAQYDKAKELLGDTDVGIFVLYDSGNLLCRKKAKRHTENLSHEVIFRILRKREFESILLKYFKELPNVNSFAYYRECLNWLETLDVRILQKEMCKCLKERMPLQTSEKFEEEIPYELRFYAYFTKKYRYSYDKINHFWESKLEV